ncbi:MAG TPA: M42 family metallopeptidase [Candidatus Fimiplasma intestinipullorum]|uniref:M42 family metallopeptidase n=1 Tax=Candidatus Fimiplasma intestinipullorum TaxID=2840825 RepID=A0A9D1L0J6_9FIRM|nr:M42 family metallopeptidase [Candidatus Fimiplasma intestinipullorum]
MEFQFKQDVVATLIQELMAIDSPSGYTQNAIAYIENKANAYQLPFMRTHKGNGIIYMPGRNAKTTIGVCAHVDTLGLMVRSIKSNGRLCFTKVGGPILPSLDSEWCKVYTREGKVYSGTIYSTSPAAHVFKDAASKERTEDTMEVILDEKVKSKEEVEKLGIQTGDYICFDPKTTITENGFIKSRFLDDKLSVAIILGIIDFMVENHIQPENNVKFMFSTYEEVGHGMAYIPEDITELLCVDMGCIGQDLNCSEYDVSICAKDSSGPYDYQMTGDLIAMAKKHQLQYAVDIYPYYGSDASAALRAGHDIRAALIGPGVFASHGYERSTMEAVDQSMQLVYYYLTNQ